MSALYKHRQVLALLFQTLLTGSGHTSTVYSSWCAVVCIHRQLTWQGLVCVRLQGMELDLAESMCIEEG